MKTTMGFSNFDGLHTQGPRPVVVSSGATAPLPPVMVLKGLKQEQHVYPEQDHAMMQRELAAADPWKAGPEVVARRDVAGNVYFTDRQGRRL